MHRLDVAATGTPSPGSAVRGRPFQLEGWQVDPVANEISNGDRTARIEPKAMRLLACLAARAERPVTREELCAAIWPDVVVGDDSLSRLVFQLRRVFGDDSRRPRFIQTLPKVGYRLAVAAPPAADCSTRDIESPALPVKRTHVGAASTHAPCPTSVATTRDHALERTSSSSVLLVMAVLGCAFSGGWWTGRLSAHRRRHGARRRAADRVT